MFKNKKNLLIAGGSLCIILLVIIIISQNKQKRIEQEVIPAYQNHTVQEDASFEDTDDGLTPEEEEVVQDASMQKSLTVEEQEATTVSNDGNEGMAVVDENIEKNFTVEPIDEVRLTEIDSLVKSYYDTSKKLSEAIVIVEDPGRLQEIQAARKAIEKYENIQTYVKHGLEPDSYVVFTDYEMKLEQIYTLAPGMSMLYLVTDEEGKLRVQDKITDEINTYAYQLLEKEDIRAVIDTVNTKLTAAMKKDGKLKEFIEYLKKADS